MSEWKYEQMQIYEYLTKIIENIKLDQLTLTIEKTKKIYIYNYLKKTLKILNKFEWIRI